MAGWSERRRALAVSWEPFWIPERKTALPCSCIRKSDKKWTTFNVLRLTTLPSLAS